MSGSMEWSLPGVCQWPAVEPKRIERKKRKTRTRSDAGEAGNQRRRGQDRLDSLKFKPLAVRGRRWPAPRRAIQVSFFSHRWSAVRPAGLSETARLRPAEPRNRGRRPGLRVAGPVFRVRASSHEHASDSAGGHGHESLSRAAVHCESLSPSL